MSAMKEFLSNSYLFGANAPFIEELYEAYLDDPQSVREQWREYFDRLQGGGASDVAHAPIVEAFAQRAKAGATRPRLPSPGLTASRCPCCSSSPSNASAEVSS